MPDSKNEEHEELGEIAPDEEFEKAFNDAQEGKTEEEEDESDNSGKADRSGDDDSGDSSEEGDEDEEEEDDETSEDKSEEDGEAEGEDEEGELSAKEIAELRAKAIEKELGQGEDKGEDEEEESGKSEEDDEESPRKVQKASKEMIKAFMDVIDDNELPDEEVIIGDTVIDFNKFKEDFPDEYQAVKVMSGMAAKKIVDMAIESGEIIRKADLENVIKEISGELGGRIESVAFWSEVNRFHPDAEQIINTNEFQGWLEKQTPGIQALVASPDAEDAISLLDYYKEEGVKTKVKEKDDSARNRKKKKDAVLSGAIGGSRKTITKKQEESKDDFQAGFEEATK